MKWIFRFYRSSCLCNIMLQKPLFAARSITSIFSIMTPLNLIHYAKCFFALEYFSKDSPSLLLKAEIVTFACLSYYVTCHMKIYQSNFRDFFVFLGITPVFSLPYPLCLICLGIALAFSPPIPILSHLSGYHACFSSLIPTPTHSSWYHACFFAFHTHYVYLVKNCLRTNNSPSKKLGLLFQLFWNIFKNA